jgi:hypothetical protein
MQAAPALVRLLYVYEVQIIYSNEGVAQDCLFVEPSRSRDSTKYIGSTSSRRAIQ